jgi:hypothetical protein
MRTKDGGPAFPGNEEALLRNMLGMSLRDYFAAKAMQSFVADALTQDADWQRRNLPKIGAAAYSVADNMLAAREAP